jgi:Ca2+-binding EF-hand superfamily protein
MSARLDAIANSILETTRFLEMEAKFVAFINDKTQLDAQWRSLDFNGNGIVSLAELDKWIVQSFPLLNNKAALRRAFIRTTSKDGDGDEWVQRREFKALLVNVIYFNRAFELFDSIDTGRDQRVDFEEFFSAVGKLGLGLDRKQALAEFQRIDSNGGGQVLFDEFCQWLVEINSFKFKERMRGAAYVESTANRTSPAAATAKQGPSSLTSLTTPTTAAASLMQPVSSGSKSLVSTPKQRSFEPTSPLQSLPSASLKSATLSRHPPHNVAPVPNPAVQGSIGSDMNASPAQSTPVVRKSFESAFTSSVLETTRFLEMEAKFVAFINDKTQLDAQWRSLDFNGNGIVSLAELDKWIVQSFPLLNNKAALRRAFIRTTSKDGDGDEWVQRREFKALLVNVIYFNRAFELFDSIDTGRDQRVDFEEFFSAVGKLGLGLDRKQALAEFQRIDSNGGGQVLFDEFCQWLVEINSFKFKERMRGAAYVESTANRTSPAAATAKHGNLSPNQMTPPSTIRSRALPSPSVPIDVSASAAAFDQVELQFVRFISSREQLIAQWSVLDSSSVGVVSFSAFQSWLSHHFPALNDQHAIKLAFERVYEGGIGELTRLQFKDFGAILVNVLFFCRALDAYKHCGLPIDQGVDVRDFKRLLVSLNMETAHAEALAQ